MDESLEKTLKHLYDGFSKESEITVSGKEYDQQQIDALAERNLVSKTVVSTLSGWSYILRPTYAGICYFSEKERAKTAENRHKVIEVLKFAIPTIISIIALIVSILK